MKLVLIIALLTVFPLAASGQSKKESDSCEINPLAEQVKSAESMLWKAYTNHDTKALERVLADDLSFIKENGFVSSKNTEIKVQTGLSKSGGSAQAAVGEDLNHQINNVRLYGDTAVATGAVQEKDTDGSVVVFHFTDTWVKKGGVWQVVAIQITTVSREVKDNQEKTAKQ